jgi:spore coat protein U-like protein
MRASAFTLFLIMVTGISLKVGAQSLPGNSTQSGTLSLTIVQLMDLSVTSVSTVDFNFSSISKLDPGIEKTGAVTLTFRSNKQWLVSIQALGSGNFTGGSAQRPMPASILKYRLGGTSTYASLTTIAAPVTSSGMPRGAGTIGVDYKMNPGYVYAPANYSLSILYTLSNQ